MTTDDSTSDDLVTDPLRAVAMAMKSSAAAVREEADGAIVSMQRAMPATGNFISRFVYTTSYFVSYGVVFPTMFVAYVVPGLGVVADGLIDGTDAACKAVNAGKARRSARKDAARDELVSEDRAETLAAS